MGTKNYITPHGQRALSEELQQLLRVERPEVCKLVQWAAGNGDRSENADYQYGKKRLREIDRRVRFLSGRLENAEVVNPALVRATKVQFGATVTVRDEEGAEKTWSIVGVDEVDTLRGHISWQSPVGRALLGKEPGDEAVIVSPQGEATVEVIAVNYLPLSEEPA
jgi:transcription elongation factor GreB